MYVYAQIDINEANQVPDHKCQNRQIVLKVGENDQLYWRQLTDPIEPKQQIFFVYGHSNITVDPEKSRFSAIVSTVGSLKNFTQFIIVHVVNSLQSHYFLNNFGQEGEVRNRPKVFKFLIIKSWFLQQRTDYSLFKFIGHNRGLEKQFNNFPDHSAKEIKTTKAACKRTQHCWPTTPNIVGCYILRPFAHPVACCWMLLRVVAQSLKPVKRLALCKRTQHCWPTTPNIVGSCCARLHVA